MAQKTQIIYGPPLKNTSRNLRTGNVTRFTDTPVFEKITSNCVSSRSKPVPLTPTPLEITREYRNPNRYVRLTATSVLEGSVVHVYSGYPTALLRTFGEADALVTLNRALSKAAVGEVNVGTFVGEFASTKGMVVNRLSSIQNFFTNVRDLKWHDIERQYPGKMSYALHKKIQQTKRHERLSNHYLELQFGWLPLISDVYNSLDAFRTALRTRGSTVRSSSRGSTQNGRNSAGFVAVVKNPALNTLNQLGLANPLVVLWELVPFSFLIDYFINIGDSLKDLTLGLGLDKKFAWYIYEDTSTNYYVGGSWYNKQKFVHRKVIANPSITVQLNEVRSSFTRASTTLALGFQRLK